jgi:hypothetical protein
MARRGKEIRKRGVKNKKVKLIAFSYSDHLNMGTGSDPKMLQEQLF